MGFRELDCLTRRGRPTKEVDKIDEEILKNLLEDGRKEFALIAKQCGTSKKIIWNHYRELEKDRVIVGSTVHLNYAYFGFNAVGSIQINAELSQVDNINNEIRKIPNIYGAYRLGKSLTTSVIVTLRTVDELEKVKETIKRIPGVMALQTEIWTGVKNIPENLKINSSLSNSEELVEKSKTSVQTSVISICKIDEIDNKIIEKLSFDGRMSFRKIAKELGISTDTVARRYKELRRNNAIKVLIQIDPAKIGYLGHAIFLIAFAYQKTVGSVVETISNIPNVTLIMRTSGSYDLSVWVLIKNLEQLIWVQDEISSIPGITKVQTSIVKSHCPWPGPKEYMSTF
jgi:Lrp/AsnC family transcriptional regulator for asnA, asnC and gidA